LDQVSLQLITLSHLEKFLYGTWHSLWALHAALASKGSLCISWSDSCSVSKDRLLSLDLAYSVSISKDLLTHSRFDICWASFWCSGSQ